MSEQPKKEGLSLGQGVLAVVLVVGAGIGLSKLLGSSNSSPSPPPPVTTASEASKYRAPDEGSTGTIDCHGDRNVARSSRRCSTSKSGTRAGARTRT